MSRLRKLLLGFGKLPQYLVPSLVCSAVHPKSMCAKHTVLAKRRPSILDLVEKFESAKNWGNERVFQAWAMKQPFRQCLPRIFEWFA